MTDTLLIALVLIAFLGGVIAYARIPRARRPSTAPAEGNPSTAHSLGNSRRPSVYEAGRQSLESQGVRFGPIRHTILSPELVARIRRLEEVFAGVYPISHQEWLDGFQRDQSPEKQIAIWEQISSAYTAFLSQNEISAEGHREAFALLLSMPSQLESKLSNLKHLTPRQAKNLLALL